MQENESMVEQRCTLLDLTREWSLGLREVILSRMRSYPNRTDHRGLERVAAEMVELIQNSDTAEEAVAKIKNLPDLA